MAVRYAHIFIGDADPVDTVKATEPARSELGVWDKKENA